MRPFKKPCLEPGCPGLAAAGKSRCVTHERAGAVRKAASRKVSRRVARQVKRLGGGRCAACGRFGHVHVDHVIGLKEGGTDSLENLQLLCTDCHRSKTVAAARARAGRSDPYIF